jgi:hypothetical protein
MKAADVDTTPVGSVRSRPRAPLALVGLAALCVATWLGVALLAAVPRTDSEGRLVLFVWHRTSGWWQGSLTLLAAALTVVLAVCLPVVVVRRWVPRPWRAFTASVGSVLVLAVGGYLAVLSFLSVALVGAEGTQVLLTGAGGRQVLVTQDGFDGDVVAVWQPTGRLSWVRDAAPTTLDPRAGTCHLEPSPGGALVACGPTSQPLDPPPAR